MLDRILAVGVNADGLFYNGVNPRTGDLVDGGISDSWGYIYDGYYTVFMVDGTTAYREAIACPLAVLNERYRGFGWDGASAAKPKGGADGYADTIESALNLYNRFVDDPRVASVVEWMDSEIRQLWSYQRPDGIIEGWHGDGNFARTTIMYCLWKAQGVSAHPWRADLRLGAVREGDTLKVVVSAEKPWNGTLVFDRPRHAENLQLPADWPRINQFPEWFTVHAGRSYCLQAGSTASLTRTGAQLAAGFPVRLAANENLELSVSINP